MLTLTCLGAAGVWMGCSNQAAPRFFRGFLSELGRPILKPEHRPEPGRWVSNSLTASWLGHSTVLIHFYGVTILTDPVLYPRIGADLKIGTVGPKRLVAPPLSPEELPHIDLVLLSHAHMDHMDLPTLSHFDARTKVVTARDTADILRGTNMRKGITELGWGDKTTVNTQHGKVHVQAFEVNHWGARWRHDKHRGFNGYVVEREGKKIIFGGDTAWTPTFRPLRNRAPYDLAIMPIGSYKPWIKCHCNPEQAVSMANDAGANYFLPVHFNTFVLGRESRTEPLERVEAVLEPERLALRQIGETFRMN
jgi:L-ascorbate metabolism protein UlaG (beta-lactamase superfamily)